MNEPIVRIYVLIVGLFAGLVGFTTWWSVIKADDLRENPANRRPLLEEQKIARGKIQTADGVLVAQSFPQGQGERQVYIRRYSEGDTYGHPVGYSYVQRGRSGIELSENDLLVGRENEFLTILEQLEGASQEGANLTMTVDSRAQEAAIAGLAGRKGAVVAIEPDTGAVRAMVSTPGFDPNDIPEAFGPLVQNADSPLLNRATQAEGYPPGSTMKVVTAVAALDSGQFETTSTVDGSSPQTFSGVPLNNFGNESFGQVSLTDALTNSVNTAWANVSEELGADKLFEYMERFGFGEDPPLDYPDSQLRASGVRGEGADLLGPEEVDIARVGIGQGGLSTTPLQMAMVAAAVANDGELMEPTFVQRAIDPDGREIEELNPDGFNRVMSEETANEVTEMMTRVTQEGTAAGLSVGGSPFAGKTGTAEINLKGLNQPWFIGFAPAADPQIAIAVTVERVQGGTGGGVAGPIATRVMAALL